MFYKGNELISVLIIEDHPIYRAALRGYLETRPDRFHIIGDAGTREDGLQLVKKFKPDIVLLDLGLPERTEAGIEEGLEAIQQICAASPSTRVMVLTFFEETNTILRAIRAGATTYLLKANVSGQKVIENLLRVQAGERPMGPKIMDKLWKVIQGQPAIEYMPLAGLTPRELEVLRLIAEDKANQEIADALSISRHTVRKHVSNMLDKLDLHNRVELKIYHLNKYSQLALPP